MIEQTVRVSLSFWTRPDDLIPESDALAFFAANPKALNHAPEQEGVITIEGDGDPLPIGDVVLSMVPLLCFDAVASLVATGVGMADAFSNDTHVELRRDGETIRLECTAEHPRTFPARPLLEALVEAGSRFVTLAEQLWPARADQLLPSVRVRESAARSSLSKLEPASN